MAINKFFIRYKFSDAKLNVVLEDFKRKTNELIDHLEPMDSTGQSVSLGDLSLYDTDKSDILTFKWDEDDSNPRDFKLKINKGDRTLDLSGDLTVESASILNQDYTTDANVIFAGLTINGDSNLDGAVTINDSNADKDFRVEGSGATYTHLLFTDASANMVGVNEDEPKALLHIRGATCTDYAGLHPDTILLLENDDDVSLQLQAATDGEARIVFADNVYSPSAGRIMYDFAAEQMVFGIGGNEKVYFTTTGARFVQNEMEIDSPTAHAAFIANSHNADAYFSLEEDEAIKWSMGFDYTDSLKFQISEGIPGTNTVYEISPSGGSLSFVRDADKGLMYLDTEETTRWMLRVASSTNVVELLNRASNGKVEIHANTSTAGVDGDTLVATFEDDLITLPVSLRIGGDTNYATFASDGTLTLTGTARVIRKIYLNNAAFTKGGTAPTQVILGNLNGWEFDIGDDAVMTRMLRPDWATGTDLTVKVCWYINEAYASDKEIQWRVDWSALPHDFSEAVDSPTHSGQIDSGVINIPAVAKRMGTSTIGTISGASLSVGDMLGFTLSRIDVAGDDPTAKPTAHHLVIEYTANKLGT